MNNEQIDPAIELAGVLVDILAEKNFDVIFNALAVATAGIMVDYATAEPEGDNDVPTIDNGALEVVKQEYLAGLYKAINYIKQQISQV